MRADIERRSQRLDQRVVYVDDSRTGSMTSTQPTIGVKVIYAFDYQGSNHPAPWAD